MCLTFEIIPIFFNSYLLQFQCVYPILNRQKVSHRGILYRTLSEKKFYFIKILADTFFLRPKITKEVLRHSVTIDLLENQVFINTSSLINWRSTVIKIITSRNKLVSSANIIVFNIEDTLFKSFMYRRNKIGPIMDPCGTPQTTFASIDWFPSIDTYCFQLAK